MPLAGGARGVVVAGVAEGGARLALGLVVAGAEGEGTAPDEGEGVTQTAFVTAPAGPDAPFRYRVYAGWHEADPDLATVEGLADQVAADARRWAAPARVTVSASGPAAVEPEALLDRAVARLRPHLAEPAVEGAIPRSLEADGATVRRVGAEDWTSGFYAATLWHLYAYSGDDAFEAAAERWTRLQEPLRDFTENHDVGFMVGLPVGLGLALTDDPTLQDRYRDVLTGAARSLATRFDPETRAIRSWDSWLWEPPQPWLSPVIIDNMMNLEILYDAARLIGDGAEADALRAVARSHADVTIENHFRPDNSSVHLVDYDPETGAVLERVTHQGYSDESAWARGQAWGLYGYEAMYRLSGDRRYLDQARRIAAFVLDPRPAPGRRRPAVGLRRAAGAGRGRPARRLGGGRHGVGALRARRPRPRRGAGPLPHGRRRHAVLAGPAGLRRARGRPVPARPLGRPHAGGERGERPDQLRRLLLRRGARAPAPPVGRRPAPAAGGSHGRRLAHAPRGRTGAGRPLTRAPRAPTRPCDFGRAATPSPP